MPARSYPKKLTTATCGLSVDLCEKVAAEQKGKEVPVLRIGGTVRSMEEKSSQFGPYKRFKGDFEAVNCVTGEIYRSGDCILPPCAETPIVDLVMRAKEQEGAEAAVQFGVDITVKYYKHPTLKGTEFVWGARPLGEQADSPMSALLQSFGAVPLIKDKTKK